MVAVQVDKGTCFWMLGLREAVRCCGVTRVGEHGFGEGKRWMR